MKVVDPPLSLRQELVGRGTVVFAHRGCSGVALENTRAAVLQAVACGAPGLEVDLGLTADGTAVVFHDDNLERLAGRAGLVREMTWAELERVELHGGHRILVLPELLALWPADRWLNLELKSGGAALLEQTLEHIEGRAGIILSSFDPALLGVGPSPHERALLLAPDSPSWLHRDGPRVLGVQAVHLDHRLCSPARVDAYRRAGLQVGAYTVNDPARARALADLGVTRLFSDFP